MNQRIFKNIAATLFVFFASQTIAFANPANQLFREANSPSAGNPKGKITIAEFFDYQCSHCVSMAPVIANIIKSNKDVRIVFKDFPIRGEMSTAAAQAAIAAGMQGKYYELSHALLSLNQPLTNETIFKIAESVGVNVAKLKKDMESRTVKNQLAANDKLANELRLSGTPAFFIGKTDAEKMSDIHFALGEMTQSEMQSAIDTALKG